MKRFSIVIPALNEQDSIARCIRSVRRACGESFAQEVEILLADGGSRDDTVKVARQEGVPVIAARPGRGLQCNQGAAQTLGDIILFLHADTLLPENAFDLLSSAFSNPAVKTGTFRLSFDHPHPLLRFYCWFSRFDSLITRYGDQCIVVRRDFFTELGGFPEWPLFEDVGFLRKAREKTRIISFPAAVVTSARRYLQHGMVRQQLRNANLVIQYLLGVPPEELAWKYGRSENDRVGDGTRERADKR